MPEHLRGCCQKTPAPRTCGQNTKNVLPRHFHVQAGVWSSDHQTNSPEKAVLENTSSRVSRPSPVGEASTAMRVSCAIGSDCRSCN